MLKTSQLLEWECGKGHIWKANFNNVKDKESWCPHCREWKTEEKCREIFEKIFDKKFPKAKNIFGSRLELDGYCEELGLAFEYNGEQHYKVCRCFKMTDVDLEKVQKRDKRKAQLCGDKGINLVVIPYTKSQRLDKYIKSVV